MNQIRLLVIRWVLQALAGILATIMATALLIFLQPLLGVQVIALLYLVPVLISTAMWGLVSGIVAALGSFLTLNYFFIPPYYTLSVRHSEDLLTLLVFLAVAIFINQLIGRAKAGEEDARKREGEATRLYELSAALSSLQSFSTVSQTLADHVRETFQAVCVEVVIEGRSGKEGLSVFSPADHDSIEGIPLNRTPMQTARSLEGEIRLWRKVLPLNTSEERLMQTFANQGALAIERIRLTRSENRARVLEESDKLKSALLSSVSHELRTPLAAIKASVSSLRSGDVEWESGARHELLADIEEETDHLNQLVGNLLDMSRIETGTLKPYLKWNSLAEIVGGVLHRMRATTQNHKIVLDFPDDLPLVQTDYVLMEQVFTNLISNSVKYAPLKSAIQILARVEPGDTVIVTVTNQGPPVAEEHLSRIFDKFYRVTAAEKVTGTGLGLSICKGILEAHGGSIWAENSPQGFTFKFRLPLNSGGARLLMPKDSNDK
jgi:two-component system, OmpR family, sensor histidine kinase KdpD